MGIIKDIYLGNNVPIEKSTNEIKGYSELHTKWLAVHDRLESELKGEQRELFEEMVELGSTLEDMFSTDCYITGFKNGARLIMEILDKGGDADAEIRNMENSLHTER